MNTTFENWSILNLWEPTFRKLIEYFFQKYDTPIDFLFMKIIFLKPI
jgi:hypothetical protein